jgi:hypothetical protein
MEVRFPPSGLDPGALISATHLDVDGPVLRIRGERVRIEGLGFRGPVTTDHRDLVDMNIQAFAIMDDSNWSMSNGRSRRGA